MLNPSMLAPRKIRVLLYGVRVRRLQEFPRWPRSQPGEAQVAFLPREPKKEDITGCARNLTLESYKSRSAPPVVGA